MLLIALLIGLVLDLLNGLKIGHFENTLTFLSGEIYVLRLPFSHLIVAKLQ